MVRFKEIERQHDVSGTSETRAYHSAGAMCQVLLTWGGICSSRKDWDWWVVSGCVIMIFGNIYEWNKNLVQNRDNRLVQEQD